MKIITGRFQRNEKADWMTPLDGSENIIVTTIESYFMLPWSRHYAKIDEGQLAVRIISLITTAIKAGHIPLDYALVNHMPLELFFSNKFIPRTIIKSWFCLVSDYLSEKRMKPENIRSLEYDGLRKELDGVLSDERSGI